MSPLLFTLVMDSLRLHIKRAIIDKACKPLVISGNISFSHNLFIDNILIVAMLCHASWDCLYSILGKFQKATGLCINGDKSSFYMKDIHSEMAAYLSNLFNIQVSPLHEGPKYLGFHLKPVGYSSAYWSWIHERFIKMIAGWEFKSLSLAGRFILTQTVLVQLLVY